MAIKPKVFYFSTLTLLLLLIVSSGLNIYLYQKNKNLALTCSRNSNKPSEKIVNEISRLIDLPSESPTIATVSNLESLKGQVFFAKAQVGDVVLIFPQSRKAILYNPTKKVLVNVATIDWGS